MNTSKHRVSTPPACVSVCDANIPLEFLCNYGPTNRLVESPYPRWTFRGNPHYAKDRIAPPDAAHGGRKWTDFNLRRKSAVCSSSRWALPWCCCVCSPQTGWKTWRKIIITSKREQCCTTASTSTPKVVLSLPHARAARGDWWRQGCGRVDGQSPSQGGGGQVGQDNKNYVLPKVWKRVPATYAVPKKNCRFGKKGMPKYGRKQSGKTEDFHSLANKVRKNSTCTPAGE